MPISPARNAAFAILLRVSKEDAYAAELLHASQYANLAPADHGLATELVMGVLRWQSVLDEKIAAHSSQAIHKLDLEVLISLRLGVYQIDFLERVPVRAAIHESVELVKQARKRSAAGFVNAVLRKAAQQPAKPGLAAIGNASTSRELAALSAHPEWMVDRWINTYGIESTRQICAFDQRPPQTAIRLADPAAEAELITEGIEFGPGELLTSARRVLSGDVTRTKAFRAGQVPIQDEASQLVALMVGKGERILDCCAAPGGKTRVLAEENPRATILAVELHPHRARLLRRLAPNPNIKVLCADSTKLPFTAQFDRILVDAPCSGTGTLARNPEIKWRLKPEDLSNLAGRQLAILQSAMQRLCPGGRLLYSTCSLEPEENQEVVQQALSCHGEFRLLSCRGELERLQLEGKLSRQASEANKIDTLVAGPYLRTLPGVHPCEGFFAALLEKIA